MPLFEKLKNRYYICNMIDLEAMGIKLQEDEEDERIRFSTVEVKGACGYFDNRESEESIAIPDEDVAAYYKDTEIFEGLLRKGFRRSGEEFYLNNCKNCKECTPIRIPARKFKPSKSQLKIWKKNADLEVTIVQAFHGNVSVYCTTEKAKLYRDYDYYHNKNNPGYKKMSLDEAKNILFLMHMGYSGAFDMEYRLNGKLVGVGLLDYTQDPDGSYKSLSSNYFYYSVEEEVRKRSIGVYSVLMEIIWCRQFDIRYYYLGLFLKNCHKMNYKTNYKPYELFEDGKWNFYDDRKEDIK